MIQLIMHNHTCFSLYHALLRWWGEKINWLVFNGLLVCRMSLYYVLHQLGTITEYQNVGFIYIIFVYSPLLIYSPISSLYRMSVPYCLTCLENFSVSLLFNLEGLSKLSLKPIFLGL